MKFEAGNIYFNGIYIIQSLREDDRKTGQELYDDIIRRRTSSTLAARVDNISSKAELFEHFKFILQNIKKGILPFIHFETHGYKEGIQLNDDTEISWQELVPSIRQINLLTKNNLFISMAACQGGNIQFCVKVTEPSPFRGFIGPMEDVGENDMLNSYNDFFNVLLLENDFAKAIDALNASAQLTKYHHMSVETFFDAVMHNYEINQLTNPKRTDELIEFLMVDVITKNPKVISHYGNMDLLKKSIEKFVKEKKPEALESLRKRFCHSEQ